MPGSSEIQSKVSVDKKYVYRGVCQIEINGINIEINVNILSSGQMVFFCVTQQMFGCN